MRNVSIATCFDYNISLDEQLSMISEAGFTHVSLGGNYKHSKLFEQNQVLHIKQLLKYYKLTIDTIHGCCADDHESITVMKHIIDVALALEVPVVVMHVIKGFEISAELVKEKIKHTLEVCRILEVYIKDKPIKIALENLFPGFADQVLHAVLEQLNPKYFGFCYDASHEQVDGPHPITLLQKYKDRVIAVHLSDRLRPFVDHAIPGEGFIDFEALTKALKKTVFNGPILLELMLENSKLNHPQDFLNSAYEKAIEIHTDVYGE